jgi:hypothetical protein
LCSCRRLPPCQPLVSTPCRRKLNSAGSSTGRVRVKRWCGVRCVAQSQYAPSSLNSRCAAATPGPDLQPGRALQGEQRGMGSIVDSLRACRQGHVRAHAAIVCVDSHHHCRSTIYTLLWKFYAATENFDSHITDFYSYLADQSIPSENLLIKTEVLCASCVLACGLWLTRSARRTLPMQPWPTCARVGMHSWWATAGSRPRKRRSASRRALCRKRRCSSKRCASHERAMRRHCISSQDHRVGQRPTLSRWCVSEISTAASALC